MEKLDRNYVAVFIWVFAGLWIASVVFMTLLVIRDGPPGNQSPLATAGILLFFCLGAVGLALFTAQQACYKIHVLASGGVSVTVRYPLRVLRKTFSFAEISPATLIKTEDSEGDDYYICQLLLGKPFESPVKLAEGHHRDVCEAVCRSFNEAIGKSEWDGENGQA